MGYIFDALNRSDDEQRRDPATPADPSPPTPADLPGPDADDAIGADDFAAPEDVLDEAAPSPQASADTQPEPVASAQDSADDDFADFEAPPADDLDTPITPQSIPESVEPATFADEPAPSLGQAAFLKMSEPQPAPAAPLPAKPIAQPTAQATPAPVARTLPLDPKSTTIDERLVAISHPGSIMAEQYRSIRTALLAKWQNKRNLIHTITSATPQEGKTITSLNLGLTFAELRNRRTIVLECDLRLPTFAKLLDFPPHQGITDFLRGEADFDDITHRVGDTGLTLCCAGSRADTDAVQLLHSQTMGNLLQRLRSEYDHVIIDTPPVVELADAGILGAQSDEVLLVSRMNRTPRTMIEQAISTLQSYHAPVSGMIATDQQRTRRRHYQYRYGYRYRYGYTYGQGEKKSRRKAA
ncbi:MAG: AAA family ATPase [Planctomycetota bacterium]